MTITYQAALPDNTSITPEQLLSTTHVYTQYTDHHTLGKTATNPEQHTSLIEVYSQSHHFWGITKVQTLYMYYCIMIIRLI